MVLAIPKAVDTAGKPHHQHEFPDPLFVEGKHVTVCSVAYVPGRYLAVVSVSALVGLYACYAVLNGWLLPSLE